MTTRSPRSPARRQFLALAALPAATIPPTAALRLPNLKPSQRKIAEFGPSSKPVVSRDMRGANRPISPRCSALSRLIPLRSNRSWLICTVSPRR